MIGQTNRNRSSAVLRAASLKLRSHWGSPEVVPARSSFSSVAARKAQAAFAAYFHQIRELVAFPTLPELQHRFCADRAALGGEFAKSTGRWADRCHSSAGSGCTCNNRFGNVAEHVWKMQLARWAAGRSNRQHGQCVCTAALPLASISPTASAMRSLISWR